MKALGNKLIIRHVFGEENKTKSGIILPGKKSGLIGPFQTGEVISKGKDVDPEINIHDYVLYEYGSCNEIDVKHASIENQYIQAVIGG